MPCAVHAKVIHLKHLTQQEKTPCFQSSYVTHQPSTIQRTRTVANRLKCFLEVSGSDEVYTFQQPQQSPSHFSCRIAGCLLNNAIRRPPAPQCYTIYDPEADVCHSARLGLQLWAREVVQAFCQWLKELLVRCLNRQTAFYSSFRALKASNKEDRCATAAE